MNLEKKKLLAVRTIGIGKDRIIFNKERLDETKEAITKQDIRDLLASGAIYIKEIKGKKKIEKRKNRKRAGSKKQSKKETKQDYVRVTRKLRSYIKQLKKKGQISKNDYRQLRREIKASTFDDIRHLKERIRSMTK